MVILYFLRPGRVFIQIIFSLCKSSFPLPVCILAHSFVLCSLARGPSSAGSLENFVDPFYYSARRTARHVCVEKIIKCGKQRGGRKYTARKEPLHDWKEHPPSEKTKRTFLPDSCSLEIEDFRKVLKQATVEGKVSANNDNLFLSLGPRSC